MTHVSGAATHAHHMATVVMDSKHHPGFDPRGGWIVPGHSSHSGTVWDGSHGPMDVNHGGWGPIVYRHPGVEQQVGVGHPMAMVHTSGPIGVDGNNTTVDGKITNDSGSFGISGHYDTNGTISHGSICAQAGNPPDHGVKVCEFGTWGHNTTVEGGWGW